jgi:hypothetical protein
MAYIGKKPEDAFRGLAYYDTFTGDGSTTTFDLSADAPDGGQNDITVVVDNVRQEPGASKSYTLGVDGSSRYRRVTFNTAPDNLSEIYVINPGRSTSLVQVSDNTISAAKLQTDAVTTAKIQDSAVTTAKIGPAAITAPLMGPAAVGTSNIAPGAITTTQISPSAAITNAQLANSSITINGNAVSLGGSITAGTDWQAVTVADGSTTLNAVAGKGYFLDTNVGVIEVRMPTSPTRGDTVILVDYSGTFATNNVIVDFNGSNLDSTTALDVKLDTNDTIAEFVYVDAAKGWLVKYNSTKGTSPTGLGNPVYNEDVYINATGGTVTTSGDYRVHTFTGDDSFIVSNITPGTPGVVDYLVIAGGGASNGDYGTGAGAGGFRMSNSLSLPAPTTSPLANPTGVTVSAGTYPITVGAGGAQLGGPGTGAPGSNSVFSTITSTGGGGGGYYLSPSNPASAGKPGGSGSGGGHPGVTTAGSGNTPPTSPPQGNDGGVGSPNNNGQGGGGGAGGAGTNGGPPSTAPGVGGVGSYVSPCMAGCYGTPGPVGSTRYFAGGGGGGSDVGDPSGVGGAGGGGNANIAGPGSAGRTDGGTNTGGGGGGGPVGGTSGGKGIVILRYKIKN